MSDDQGRHRAPDFVFLVSVLLVAQALGTMAAVMLGAALLCIAITPLNRPVDSRSDLTLFLPHHPALV